ncbi:uncharacterized protein B0I36DRAFT_57481 [Microdochium trichocladiopsis]|uniref:Uncharacterized protein n=1 Tax=Microdochium trichocladiopsis TaxID=1682393 RepID=A0A9P9BF61_9PEZI|nr:uncharacterized protein B0I36DRAFT_57481 [Microdochium trichocladiopsis]KAH7010590.1 hypothetical protein B0I36DRAFT_57481 [Microdochium trichocladiopsis]
MRRLEVRHQSCSPSTNIALSIIRTEETTNSVPKNWNVWNGLGIWQGLDGLTNQLWCLKSGKLKECVFEGSYGRGIVLADRTMVQLDMAYSRGVQDGSAFYTDKNVPFRLVAEQILYPHCTVRCKSFRELATYKRSQVVASAGLLIASRRVWSGSGPIRLERRGLPYRGLVTIQGRRQL